MKLSLRKLKIPRVPGTAVFLTRLAGATPPLMVRHVEQIGALQESVIALTVKFADVPRVPRAERLEVAKLAEGFWRITAHFGFVQVPDLSAALRQAKTSGCEIDLRCVRSTSFHWFGSIGLAAHSGSVSS